MLIFLSEIGGVDIEFFLSSTKFASIMPNTKFEDPHLPQFDYGVQGPP